MLLLRSARTDVRQVSVVSVRVRAREAENNTLGQDD